VIVYDAIALPVESRAIAYSCQAFAPTAVVVLSAVEARSALFVAPS
jgi:hypothetical protein